MDKMQKIVLITLISLLVFWFGATLIFGINTPAKEAKLDFEAKQYFANRCLERVSYIKDARTGLCFAHTGGGHGSSSITNVSCEKIPSKLLTVGIANNNR